jgi:hypothetical protein
VLLGLIGCKGDDQNERRKRGLSQDELDKTTDSEVQHFAEEFLAHNRYLLEEEVPANSSGPTRLLEQNTEESPSDFLVRALEHHRKIRSAQFKKLLGPTFSQMAKSYGTLPRSLLESFNVHKGIADVIRGVKLPVGVGSVHDAARGVTGRVTDQLLGLDLSKQMQQMFDASSATAKLARQISDQEKAINALSTDSAFAKLARERARTEKALEALTPRFDFPGRSLMRAPNIESFPSRMHETNERLESIEERFDRVEAIAVDSAKIASNLQKTALKFLVKFEEAATANDRSARRALRIGALALLLAVVTPVMQIAYDRFWRVPGDEAAMQARVEQLKGEIASLQQTQQATAKQISEALSRSDKDLAGALSEILKPLLAQQQIAPGKGSSAGSHPTRSE